MQTNGRLVGAISVKGLPVHRGVIANVCLFQVQAADSPKPYAGDPPIEACTDCHQVFEQVDLESESRQDSYDLPFNVVRPVGHYYLLVRLILFRNHDGKSFAQSEQFFFGRRPVHIESDPEGINPFPVTWPDLPLSELHRYGTVTPETKRRWWRIW